MAKPAFFNLFQISDFRWNDFKEIIDDDWLKEQFFFWKYLKKKIILFWENKKKNLCFLEIMCKIMIVMRINLKNYFWYFIKIIWKF